MIKCFLRREENRVTIFIKRAVYKEIQSPVISYDLEPDGHTDETMAEHKQKILNRMREMGLAALLVYAGGFPLRRLLQGGA